MDFLNRGFAQLNELFGSMTAGARLTAALLLIVVVVSVAFLFNQQMAGPDTYLMGGQSFSSGEMPGMEAAFAKAGLQGYEVEGARFRVPRNQQAAYMAALADAGALPANFGDYMMQAVSDANPFLTGPQREEMLKTARQRELAAIIRAMPGIETAAVMFDSQHRGGLRNVKVTTASVSIKPRGMAALEEDRVPMIRHLVAGALAIPAGQVTIVDLNGRSYPGTAGGGVGSGVEDGFLSRQRKYQEALSGDIVRALSYVPGVTVVANVELDNEQERIEKSVQVDPKTVTVSTREESSTSSSDRGAPGGRPGLAAQQPNQPANLAQASQASRSEEERSTSQMENVVSHEERTVSYFPATPKRITVSVGVPDSYFVSVFRQRNPTPAGQEEEPIDAAVLTKLEQEESTKIRKHVAGLLPASPGDDDPLAQVTVTTFTHLPGGVIAEPPMQEVALAWLGQNWTTLGLVLLGLFSLMIVRSMIRSPIGAPSARELSPMTLPFPAPTAVPGNVAEPTGAAAALAASAGAATGPGLKRRTTGGPSLRDQLADIVKEDPATAANILRTWIGNAS
jgi:flagellar M-ring protein FliF